MPTEETRIPGKCSCGVPVIKITNSAKPTLYTNGDNYMYTNRKGYEDYPWYSIFRCDACSAVIEDVWQKEETVDAN